MTQIKMTGYAFFGGGVTDEFGFFFVIQVVKSSLEVKEALKFKRLCIYQQ